MHQDQDPRKRPLLTVQQLNRMRQLLERAKKGSACEEFEKLFRPPTRATH